MYERAFTEVFDEMISVPGQRLPETRLAFLTEALMLAYDGGDDAICENAEANLAAHLKAFPELNDR